jgi:5'-nucleotidase
MKCVCFDLDNTLFDYEYAFNHAVKQTYNELIKPNIDKNISSLEWFNQFKKNCDTLWHFYESDQWSSNVYKKERFQRTIKHFDLSCDPYLSEQYHKKLYDLALRFTKPYDGVYELLEWLQNMKIKVGIITNGQSLTQQRKIKTLGIHKVIPNSAIFISEEIKMAKPNREIFQYVTQKFGVHAHECYYIGDSWEVDIEGAIASGWHAIYYNSRSNKAKRRYINVKECWNYEDVIRTLKIERS